MYVVYFILWVHDKYFNYTFHIYIIYNISRWREMPKYYFILTKLFQYFQIDTTSKVCLNSRYNAQDRDNTTICSDHSQIG